MNLRHTLFSVAVGLVLLGAVVAFVVVPGGGGARGAGSASPEAAGDPALDRQACRMFDLGMAGADLDPTLTNILESLDFEQQGHDGGTEFYDWFDVEPAEQSLTATTAAARGAAGLPGTSEDLYDALAAVAATATSLEHRTAGDGLFEAGKIRALTLDLGTQLADVEKACATVPG